MSQGEGFEGREDDSYALRELVCLRSLIEGALADIVIVIRTMVGTSSDDLDIEANSSL